MIGSGQLRERIEIVRKSTVVLPDGSESKPVWNSILTTYSSMKMGSGGIDVIAAQDNISQVFQFTIRYRTDVVIRIDDRINWRGRNFKITKLDFDILRTNIVLTSRTDNESTSDGQA